MSNHDENLERSVELARAGFESAQSRITFIDTKVGLAVSLIVILLPVPLVILGWLLSLEKDAATRCYDACRHNPLLVIGATVAFIFGWAASAAAMSFGINCLTPRGAKGYNKSGAFHNEWRPNLLFPAYKQADVTQRQTAEAHFRKLNSGVDKYFIISEYANQIETLGVIISEKLSAMVNCFLWLRGALLMYALAFVFALIVVASAFCSDLRVPHVPLPQRSPSPSWSNP